MMEILIVIFGIIGLISILIALHAKRTVAYVYCGAVISAWEAKLLKENRLMEMAEAPAVENLISLLDDTEYRPLLSEISKDGTVDVKKAEIVFKDHLNHRYQEILKIVPSQRKETVLRLLKKWEVWGLKTIVTAIHQGVPVEEDLKHYMSSPTLTRERLEMLTSVKNFDQLLDFLKDSEYFPVLNGALKDYKERGLSAILSALDVYYYKSLWQEILRVKSQREILMKMIGCEIDTVNIKLILRLKKEGVAPEEIDKYLIRPSYLLTEGMLKDMVYAENIKSGLEVVSRTPYGLVLLNFLPQIEAQGISTAERALDELRLKVFREQAVAHIFSIAPVVLYILLKETEVRNLLTILRLKAEKVEPQKIKKNILGVPKIGL
ncbi:MAG: V-type ATPase subunit [Candidatus Hadarchaeum sp.]|uniref:V-type ATPase subunit n=1 Tax=Candidatus Hadarchaeum sp. TaxID=2883567 RepID=UPI003D095A91